MNTAYCIVSKAPIRQDASDKAEMVTEILFGESAEVLEKQEKWWKIACSWDGYLGWIDPKQLSIAEKEQDLGEKHCTSSALWNISTNHGNLNIPVGGEFFLQNKVFAHLKGISFSFDPSAGSKINSREDLIQVATQFLNTPYLWGGRSNYGIDCSGFTQVCHKVCGFELPRDAYQQAEIGKAISFSDIAPTDLAFFKNESGKIIHVGMMLPENKIIHAHGKIRIDQLDEKGIYNEELGRYTHELEEVRRVW